MQNNFFCSLLVLSFFSVAHADSWSLAVEKEVIKGRQKKSVLNFTNSSGKSAKYKPTEEPFTFLKEKKSVLNKKTFFVTTWAYGARSVMIRVFDPVSGVTNPICTAISDSYDPQLRVSNKYLEVEEVISELQTKPVVKWKKCISFSGI